MPTDPAQASGKRVLHVMECTIGGTRRHIGDIGRGLVERGWEVHLAVSAERTSDFRADMADLSEHGAHVYEVPMVRAVRPQQDRRHAKELEGLMREVRPHIVHTHSSKAGVLGRRAARAAGCGALVHTPHTYSFLFGEMFGPIQRTMFRALERRLSARTDRVVAVSADEAETIRASGVVDPERVRVVPNGIDVGPYEEAASNPPQGSTDGPLRVLVCGLLNVAKGQDYAISALAHAGCEDVELWIAGEGEERAALERHAATRGVADRVRFLGHCGDVPGLMKAADLLLLPSRWEGMPYVVLEAAASRLPVVATPVDGAREFLGGEERGWTASDCTEAAVATALSSAIEAGAEEGARRAEHAHRWVLDQHAMERMMEHLEAVYSELL